MTKTNYDLLVIAGTYDSHQLIKELKKYNISILATVATQTGKEMLSNLPIDILVGKLNKEDFKNLVYTKGIKCILDSSHPYAQEVSQNIFEVSKLLSIAYIRYLRPSETNNFENICCVNDIGEAVQNLNNLKGNIFLTTGSKDLQLFVDNIEDYRQRLFVRVLPTSDSILKCEELKIPTNNIIALMGCPNVDLNKEIMKYYKIDILVTKDGGKVGGFYEKVKAAQQLGVSTIIIKRPFEVMPSVSTYKQTVEYIIHKLNTGDEKLINA